MTAAVAIFVKTPGLSPIKTRLAAGVGVEAATEFHRLAAASVAGVAGACGEEIAPYWAVAEQEALDAPAWRGFPAIWQGEGGLGARLDRIYATLLLRHGRVLLIGADAPQVTPDLLRAAAGAIEKLVAPHAIGASRDGGFWIFGGRAPVPVQIWEAVAYSSPDTCRQLAAALRPCGPVTRLLQLFDVDTAEDLPDLWDALCALPDATQEQRRLAAWLGARLARPASSPIPCRVQPRRPAFPDEEISCQA